MAETGNHSIDIENGASFGKTNLQRKSTREGWPLSNDRKSSRM
jgi:hypothetical protein